MVSIDDASSSVQHRLKSTKKRLKISILVQKFSWDEKCRHKQRWSYTKFCRNVTSSHCTLGENLLCMIYARSSTLYIFS